MWYLSRSVVEKCYTARSERSWAKCWLSWPVKKNLAIETGSFQPDHVHMVISIPPKHSVAQVIGYIKGKSAIHIARTYAGKKRNFAGEQFWARGYFVSTVGKDEQKIKEYVSRQQSEDQRIDQLRLG